jgi:hypothetical protein
VHGPVRETWKEKYMPDTSITTPVATDAVDRLALGTADVRGSGTNPLVFGGAWPLCMADE